MDRLLEQPRCSFCGKDSECVKKLISNPPGFGNNRAYICDECIATCNSILEESFGPDEMQLFGIEAERIKLYADLGFITQSMLRSLADSDQFVLVNFLLQLKQILQEADRKLVIKEKTEIGKQVQKLKGEIDQENQTLRAKQEELRKLTDKLSKLNAS